MFEPRSTLRVSSPTARLLIAIAVAANGCSRAAPIPPLADAGGARAISGLPIGLQVSLGAPDGGRPGQLVDRAGNPVLLHGANRSGTEFECVARAGGDADAGFPGFFDGPNDQAGLDPMRSWGINAIRVPLNEDCWLGLNGLPVNDTASDYQAAIVAWVDLINRNDMVAILDLHWVAPGDAGSVGQLPMADADHAPAFWSSVAATFGANTSVMFDLFNEPYLQDWGCWANGTSATGTPCATDDRGQSYAVAGMASLIEAVRGTGAHNVVLLGGLAYATDFSGWVRAVQAIPSVDGISIENVVGSWHAYDFNSQVTNCPSADTNYAGQCTTGRLTALNADIPEVLAAGFPVIMGESGISAYSAPTAMGFSSAQLSEMQTWYEQLLQYMDEQGQGYLAWSWDLDTGPLLISDYQGTPTPYFGATYQGHLEGL